MGNTLGDCSRCDVCNVARLGIDQCELRTDVAAGQSSRRSGSGGAQRRASGAGAAQGAGRQEFQPANMTEADMIQQALRLSRLEAERAGQGGAASGSSAAGATGRSGSDEEAELLAAAVRKSQMQEEALERQRLREEQEAEYEESLRIDRQREAEKALRLKEEEEQRQRKAAEEEARKREAEQLRAEAEEAERVRKEKADAVALDAREKLSPEPGAGEPNRVQVLVRTPQGARLKRAFLSSDPIGQVYNYINAEGGEALAGSEYRLVSAMPRAVYEDREATLEAAGLKGQCALLVEIVED